MGLDIWIVSSGEMIAMGLNAVATILNSAGWSTVLWIAETLGILCCVVIYLKTHDLRGMFSWALTFVIVTSLLLTPKISIVVNDLTRPDRIDRVDNVPVGLAAPLWLLTGLGYTLATGYEDFFHFPDERAYTKTGMLFASKLLEDSYTMVGENAVLQDNFNEYIKNCTIPDIQLNHKFTINDVMRSADVAALIFSKPSPLRGIYYQTENGSDFLTCADAVPRLKAAIEADARPGGGTFLTHAASMLPGNKGAQTIYPGMLESSYNYFFNASKSSTNIIKQNVAIAGLRRGFNSYSKSMNDTASLVDIASESSLMKLRLSHAVSYRIASEVLPQLHTVFMLLCIAIFPVMMLALYIKEVAWAVVKNYLNLMGSLMLWPVMFAIFNFAVNFSTRAGTSGEPTLSNINRLMETSSTTAGIAGWLMISIPFISFKLFTSLGQNIASAGSYLGNSLGGAATADAAAAASGNLSYGNVQVDNINGFKRDTNVVNRDGMVTNQLANGAMITETAGGQTIVNVTEANSKMATDINFDHHMSSAAQKMTRESQAQTQTALEGYNHSVTQNAAQLKQFHEQFGNSDASTLAAQTGMSVTDAQKVNKALSLAQGYSDRNHVSFDQGFSELENKSKSVEGRVGVGASVGVDTDKSALGKLAGLAVGVSGKVDGHTGVDWKGGSGSSSQTSEGGSNRRDFGHDVSAQDMQSFNEGMDVLRNYSVTYNGAHVDNAASGLLNQISAGVNTSDSHYQQYTTSLARTHEYQQMASQTDTMSAQVRGNYNQEFVEWAKTKMPASEWQPVMADTGNPELRERREQLAEDFMEDKLRSRVEGHYEQSAAHVGDNISTPRNVAGEQYGSAYRANSAEIDQRGRDAGIRHDVKQDVTSHVDATQKNMDETEDVVNIDKNQMTKGKAVSETEYNNANSDFREKHAGAKMHQDTGFDGKNVFNSLTYKDYTKQLEQKLKDE